MAPLNSKEILIFGFPPPYTISIATIVNLEQMSKARLTLNVPDETRWFYFPDNQFKSYCNGKKFLVYNG